MKKKEYIKRKEKRAERKAIPTTVRKGRDASVAVQSRRRIQPVSILAASGFSAGEKSTDKESHI